MMQTARWRTAGAGAMPSPAAGGGGQARAAREHAYPRRPLPESMAPGCGKVRKRCTRCRLVTACVVCAALVILGRPALVTANVADGQGAVQQMRPLPGVGPIDDVLEGGDGSVNAAPGECGAIGWLAWMALLALPVGWRSNRGSRPVRRNRVRV